MAITFVPARRRHGFVVPDRFLFTPDRESVIEAPHSPATDDWGRIMRFRNVALIVLWTMLSGPVMVQPQAGAPVRMTPVRAASAAKAHKITVSARPAPPSTPR